jgi:hypothetical protein
MEKSIVEEILQMSKFRYQLLKKEDLTHTDTQKIDELGQEIMKSIKDHFDFLPFDFIMDELSRLGQCPCLINDDNGHWAVTSEGYQNVIMRDELEDVESNFFIEAKEWKNTPREALLYYLSDNDKDDDELPERN